MKLNLLFTGLEKLFDGEVAHEMKKQWGWLRAGEERSDRFIKLI